MYLNVIKYYSGVKTSRTNFCAALARKESIYREIRYISTWTLTLISIKPKRHLCIRSPGYKPTRI